MDLLRTILVYLSMIFMTSVQNAPDPSALVTVAPETTPPAYMEQIPTPGPVVPTATVKPSPVPTVDITPSTKYKTLSIGDKGDNVIEMQKKLAEYGYYEGEIDGGFGNQTRAAVEKFQYNHGLSADGIAGKNTLAVLYDSDEVRPMATDTPEPTEEPTTAPPTDELAIAQTEPVTNPPETPKATETAAPTETPVATETSLPTESPVPTETPEPEFLAMEGFGIIVPNTTDAMMTQAADEAEAKAITPYSYGDLLYVPLLEVLTQSQYNIIASPSIEMEQYAFAMGDDIYRISVLADKNNLPIDPQGYKNNVLVMSAFSDVKEADGLLYLPIADIQNFIPMTFAVDDAAKTITVSYTIAPEAE